MESHETLVIVGEARSTVYVTRASVHRRGSLYKTTETKLAVNGREKCAEREYTRPRIIHEGAPFWKSRLFV